MKRHQRWLNIGRFPFQHQNWIVFGPFLVTAFGEITQFSTTSSVIVFFFWGGRLLRSSTKILFVCLFVCLFLVIVAIWLGWWNRHGRHRRRRTCRCASAKRRRRRRRRPASKDPENAALRPRRKTRAPTMKRRKRRQRRQRRWSTPTRRRCWPPWPSLPAPDLRLWSVIYWIVAGIHRISSSTSFTSRTSLTDPTELLVRCWRHHKVPGTTTILMMSRSMSSPTPVTAVVSWLLVVLLVAFD